MVRRHFTEFGDIYRRTPPLSPPPFLRPGLALTSSLPSYHLSCAPVNILPTRGVAFVTYHSELSAQFAKEAMSNQSLDSGEILNVRWATEDPNPGMIKKEKRRVEGEGKRAIEGKLDKGLVEASLVIQALEEGREGELYDVGEGNGQFANGEDGEGGGKRRRIEQAGEESDDGEDQQPQQQEQELEVEDRSGLLDRDALEGMKYFLQIKRQREEEEQRRAGAAKPKAQAAPPKGLGGLGGYGSGSEDDE